MTPEEAIAALDAIPGDSDPEASHSAADDILLSFVPGEVTAAYERIIEREQGRWWFA